MILEKPKKTSSPDAAIRVGLKGVLLFAAAATVSAVVWGQGWNVWIPLGVMVIFIVETVVGLQKKRDYAQSEHHSTESPPPSNGSGRGATFSDFTWRGEKDCFGTSMFVGGQQVWIDLLQDSKLPQRQLAAISLVSHSADMTRKFEDFKREQATKSPEFRDEIERLVIDLIGFYDRTDPNVAEVFFTRESGADAWFCILKHREFSSLVKES